MQSGQKQKLALWKKLAAAVCALILVFLSFGAGWMARSCSQSQTLRSYSWALDIIDRYYYGDFDEEEASGLSLSALAGMLDAYSAYYTAEEYEALYNDNQGGKSGIGITYSFIAGRGALIINVVGNSPAYRSGLRSGETITGGITADGEEVVFESSAVFGAFIDGFESGESFTLCTLAGDKYTMAKADYMASYTTMSTATSGWSFASAEPEGRTLYLTPDSTCVMSFLPENCAYVSLSQFYGTAAVEFGLLMKQFSAENCTSLILDLRNNGGGYVQTMQDIAGYFTSSQTDEAIAMTAKYKSGKTENYYCTVQRENLVPEGTKVYVLANSGTASASEALIGALVCYDWLDYENIFLSDFSQSYLEWAGASAKTKQTYGKGIMQSTYVNASTGEALKLTTAQIYWQNGKCIHDVGLTEEDGCTLVYAEWTVTADDDELRRAVEIIQSRG